MANKKNEVTKVAVMPGKITSYATALRAHLSATLAYARVGDYESAEAELDCLDTCAEMIRSQVNHKLYD